MIGREYDRDRRLHRCSPSSPASQNVSRQYAQMWNWCLPYSRFTTWHVSRCSRYRNTPFSSSCGYVCTGQ